MTERSATPGVQAYSRAWSLDDIYTGIDGLIDYPHLGMGIRGQCIGGSQRKSINSRSPIRLMATLL
jgi:hypothetical protein